MSALAVTLTTDELAELVRRLARDEVRTQLEELSEDERERLTGARGDAWIACSELPAEIHEREFGDRFWSKVDKAGPLPPTRPDLGPCWLWVRGKKHGYGWLRAGGGTFMAHRIAFAISGGVLERNKTIDHLCRVRACQNPAHLEAVPILTNMRRATGSASEVARMREACVHGHLFTPENTYVEASKTGRPQRKCKACRAAIQERRKQAVKAAERRPRPDRETLEAELSADTYTAIALRYGVTDSTIKNWAIALGIPIEPRRG